MLRIWSVLLLAVCIGCTKQGQVAERVACLQSKATEQDSSPNFRIKGAGWVKDEGEWWVYHDDDGLPVGRWSQEIDCWQNYMPMWGYQQRRDIPPPWKDRSINAAALGALPHARPCDLK